MTDATSTSILNRPLVRGAIAAVVVAVAIVTVGIIRAGRDDEPDAVVEGGASPTPIFYGSTIYTLCPDDVAQPAVTNSGPPVIGQPAPDFALCDADGKLLTTLSEMNGKVVWINFWATWCKPCKKELPDIQKLYEEKQAAGLEVLLINYQEPQAKALKFLPGIAIDMPLVVDRPGHIYDQYKLTGLPDSFFVDREGKLAALYYGFVTEEIARDRLKMAGLD